MHYAYAVGRVRVLETKLLSRGTYERLLDAKSFTEQRRILSETPYGGWLEKAETAEDVERALDSALGELYTEFLERANLPKAIVRYFRIMHDFENLRGVLKAEALGIDPDDLTTALGSVPADSIGGSSTGMPAELREAEARVRAIAVDAAGEVDATLVDAAVDAEQYGVLVQIADESKSSALSRLARLSADIGNLKVFVRARDRGLSAAAFEGLLVPGGDIPHSTFVSGYKLPVEECIRRITALPGFHQLDIEAVCDPARLDLALERALAEVLHRASVIPVGPEPVLAYVATRKAEIRMLRVLLIGKLAGVTTDVLRSRIKDVA